MRVAFDVDRTLILDDAPRHSVVQLMFSLKALGAEIFAWSGGGVSYATRWAEKLGIAQLVTVIPKNAEAVIFHNIDMTIDDMDCDLAKLNFKV